MTEQRSAEPLEEHGWQEDRMKVSGEVVVRWLGGRVMAHLYVPGMLLFSLLLPRVPNNIQILLLALAVLPGSVFIWRGLLATRPYVWWLAIPLVLLCAWISIQTPLAAPQPVLLFGAKEATGLGVTLLMALVIPGVMASGHGWRPLDYAIASVTVLVALGTVFSFCTGTGERHHIGEGLFRAYFLFGDGMDVPVALMLVWHAARRQWLLAALAGLSLALMLGKLPLGLVVLFVVVAILIGRRAERLTAALLSGALALGFAIMVPLGAWVEENEWLDELKWGGLASATQEIAGGRAQRVPADDEQTTNCVARARAVDSPFVSFLLRGECAAGSAALYEGPLVVNAGINTLARRAVGGIGSAYIIAQNPILGTGYHQSWRWMDDMESIDPFGVNGLYARPYTLWKRIGQIRNPVMRVAAELGLPGAVLFVAFLLGSTIVGVRIALTARSGGAPLSPPAVAGALWVAVYMPATQTSPWLLPGSISLFWVGVALGIMLIGVLEVEKWRARAGDNETSRSPAAARAAEVRV